ncbi:CPBP family intramembrane glutamic endopeptidase [Marinilabilia salmonicolor]|uniref:CAAX prenyl protease 2/Lysostaphin resistance protein A-like domain-containing protein n=1 Tax=Marinilabilia salmonicolor TaxID=989 RepID=A0A368UIT3_9BACT|nr:CPBP family intramembrane glutamic endopeptidase [Marinilabilia salmonicolor]RCW20652.1 hypothetical protein DFO77_1602 [Marinilabilia salmonicolor]
MQGSQYRNIGWQRILMLIIPYIIVVGVFQLIGTEIVGVDLDDKGNDIPVEKALIKSFCNLIGTFIILLIFIRGIEHDRFINLGFSTKNRLKDFVVGFLIGAFIISLGYLILLIFNQITYDKFVINSRQLMFSFLLFISVSIVEETLMRGYVLRNLMISFNNYFALTISSILFALMHGFNPNTTIVGLISLLLLGFLLGIVYIHTKNLWFSIALHFSWNFFQTHLGFNVSGQDSYSLIEIKILTDNYLTGGSFGFEGSFISIIAQVLFIIGIEYYFTKKTNHNTRS